MFCRLKGDKVKQLLLRMAEEIGVNFDRFFNALFNCQ